MYSLTLALHSLLRWVVLTLGVLAAVRADDKSARWFATSLDVQLLLGLGLYVVLSPMTAIAFQDFGAAMGNTVLRFWAVEHIAGMIVAMALAHVGRARIRRTSDAARRRRLGAIFFGLAVLVLVIAIPWPGTPAASPLFRLP